MNSSFLIVFLASRPARKCDGTVRDPKVGQLVNEVVVGVSICSEKRMSHVAVAKENSLGSSIRIEALWPAPHLRDDRP